MIRKATSGDLEAIIDIEGRWPTTPQWTRSHFENELTSERSYFCVLADGTQVVGYAGLLIIPPEAQVTTVAVHPDRARKGHGRELMCHLHQEARNRSCTFLTLEVSEKNRPALKLYEALGYRIVGRRVKYYNDLSDALLMTNRLASLKAHL